MGKADDITASNTYISQEILKRLCAFEDVANADVVTVICDILPPIDQVLREIVQDRCTDTSVPKRDNAIVILETNGGSIETTERIADLFRHHWKGEVTFVVPNYAMSAGTILVMSGDHIYMDYFSVLGPIDPQVRRRDGGGYYVPALGYLEKYNRLIEKSKKGSLTAAELTFLIEKFDPAELDQFEKARDLSIDLLTKWLVKYKFKNWTKTKTRKLTVTAKMRKQRATEIAKKLNDVKKWKTHGRGLSREVLTSDINLLIEDFGAAKYEDFSRALKGYYRMLQDYMNRRNWALMLQTRVSYLAIGEDGHERG